MVLIDLLAVWRLTRLLYKESGPYDVLGRFRDWAGVRYDSYSNPYGKNELSKALICVYCLSVWVGLFIAVVRRKSPVHALAYSAGTILIERWLN